MANIAYSNYVITGTPEDLDALQAVMKKVSDTPREEFLLAPLFREVFNTEELPADISFGGDYEGVRRTENGLEFTEYAKWSPCYEAWDAIATAFNSLEVWFSGEEGGCNLYIKRDHPDKKFFPENYYVDGFSPEGNEFSEYFDTLDEAFRFIESMTGENIFNAETVEAIGLAWNERDPDCYLYLHEYEEI